jgi:Transposase DDE domain group 1
MELTIGDLVRQRLFAIACGYPDGNDTARLAQAPTQKLFIGREPVNGTALASQPTLSRFENAVRRSDLHRMR